MKIENIEDEIINSKILYLNGYLDALAILNSYFPVGMRYKLFAYDFSAGNIIESINHHSYELFGTYPNSYDFELKEVTNWKSLLKDELEANLYRRIPREIKNSVEYSENRLIQELYYNFKQSFHRFIEMLDNELIGKNIKVFKLNTDTKGAFHRIIGLDLVFEILPKKIIFLQLIGSD